MENIQFSVAMCVYGKDDPLYFKSAVDSILNQSVKPNEVILVVDGAVPRNLNSIIKEYEKDPLFNVIKFKKNQGHGIARRIGLENCNYDLVALMDADDISLKNRFELQIKMFKTNPLLDIVGGNIAEFINVPNKIVGMRLVSQLDCDIKKDIKKRCPMNQMTVMFRKESIQRVGGYLDWYCNEDYYLWIRMVMANMIFANLDEVLVNVRVGKEMYQRRGGWKYFKSEMDLQKYMLEKKLIDYFTYLYNITKRFIVQVLMPSKVRGWIYIKFARNN